ncbi:hypothetical protein M422DRAFT_256693 [Sphaerobolus stellatus SS14]|uniref:CCHC-type domain-containing protein n=1 Tax=Sphaerobolus stellatus (strain SS14) TaxID=990650 RepID=A0A0C9VGA9_SPHS4|nr:hypothetical protein M422DRAFT_256693 [Sphaerobolus stellatus SS14]
MTQSTHVTNQLTQPASERGMSEDPTQTPNPHGGSGDLLLPKTYSDYSEPKSTNGQPNIDPELIQSTARSNNRSGTKHALGKARTELSAKTAILERLYADQAPADHLNQAAIAARSTRMEYEQLLRLSKAGLLNPQDQHPSIPPSKDTREAEIQDKTCKSTTVRNHREESVPFQHLDDRDILDMSNNESDNALVRMVKYMLDQNIHTTMEKSSLATAGVKVTPPDKYSGEQSFEALKTFVKGLLQWLDMHSMLGPDAYKYQVSFLGMRLEGKALEWFNKTVEPRKYQGTPMDLEQIVTGLYGQYIPSLARREVSNKFDFIKQGTLSMQEFATELELYIIYDQGCDHCYYVQVKLEDANRYDIGVCSSEPTTSNSRQDNNVSSNTRGPPIINRQRTNHELSHNSIKCYNCGKLGHIKPNCPEPLRAHRVGAVHVEDSPTGQVNNTNLDINDTIDDEHPDEDKYRNEDYDNQLDLSEDQHSWGSKPSKFNWSNDEQTHQVNSVRYSHDLARVAAVVPIGPANARKAKIAKEGEPLYDHTVKMKTTRPARSKHDLLTITGYFLVGGTKARCLFDSGWLCMHKLLEPIGIQQALQGSRAKLYYTITIDITIGQRMYTETLDIANIDYYDIMLGTPFLSSSDMGGTKNAHKLDMLRPIYMDKPYVCNEDVYNVIIDINSALDTTNVINYYDNIVIKDGYLVHHKNNSYSTKATVRTSDYKMSLNGQNRAGVSIEDVNDEDDLHNIVKDNDIEDDNHILIDMETPPTPPRIPNIRPIFALQLLKTILVSVSDLVDTQPHVTQLEPLTEHPTQEPLFRFTELTSEESSFQNSFSFSETPGSDGSIERLAAPDLVVTSEAGNIINNPSDFKCAPSPPRLLEKSQLGSCGIKRDAASISDKTSNAGDTSAESSAPKRSKLVRRAPAYHSKNKDPNASLSEELLGFLM